MLLSNKCAHGSSSGSVLIGTGSPIHMAPGSARSAPAASAGALAAAANAAAGGSSNGKGDVKRLRMNIDGSIAELRLRYAEFEAAATKVKHPPYTIICVLVSLSMRTRAQLSTATQATPSSYCKLLIAGPWSVNGISDTRMLSWAECFMPSTSISQSSQAQCQQRLCTSFCLQP